MSEEEVANEGYDEATMRADGEDQIPTGVNPAEVGLTPLIGNRRAPTKAPRDVNMQDNSAEWSRL